MFKTPDIENQRNLKNPITLQAGGGGGRGRAGGKGETGGQKGKAKNLGRHD